MKKIFLLTVYCLLFTVYTYAQVSADSLPGTYAGQYWYANPATNPWTITNDTIYARNIDTINCIDTITIAHGPAPWFPTTWFIVNTMYYSCNSAIPSDYYTLFYNGDSLKMIYDDVAQPYPNPHYSWRFYGKRISNEIVALNELTNKKQMQIYPNPCKGELNIGYKMLNEEVRIVIIDILGREIKNVKLLMIEKLKIDVSDLREGVYFVTIQTSEGIFNNKLLIRK